jgi:hypothetical protein
MRAQLSADAARFGRELPRDWPDHVRATYGIDLRARYLGETVPHPVGKASGQLSLKVEQLEADARAGLAFVVLKTVIGENAEGERSMGAWAIHESRMAVERLAAPDGREGWTVTWKGRGWDRPFDDYLALVRAGRDLTRGGGPLIVPSAKLHLPPIDQPFRADEYRHTIARLAEAWGPGPLLIEKDFSPTLAGDPLAGERELILRWLHEVPGQVRAGAAGQPVRIAMKLMNARFDDDFQLRMLDAAGDADALTVFNRLWSAERGVAFGGWELSDRNLRVLERARGRSRRPLSGTGNVCSGRLVVAYARCGCESVQLHTYFQLPLSEYPAESGSRTERALHALVFDPVDGLVAAMLELEEQGVIHRHEGELRFMDLAR